MRKLNVLEMNRISIDEFKRSKKNPLVVVLDNVRSMYNVGSVFRTADAFRIESIYLCGITSCPPHPEIHKTALGAEEAVEWEYFKSAVEAVKKLQQQGYDVLAIEQVEGSTLLQDFTPAENKKYAVVLGNEVKGVAQEVVDCCNGCLEIPQFGTKHSLNVSTTAGIVMWELTRYKLAPFE
jgi:tRNA G18 (ribose-2'-O)-methylase SpoU